MRVRRIVLVPPAFLAAMSVTITMQEARLPSVFASSSSENRYTSTEGNLKPMNQLQSKSGERHERGLSTTKFIRRLGVTRVSSNYATAGKCSFRNAITGLLGMLCIPLLLGFSGCQGTAIIPKQAIGETLGALAAGDIVKLSFPGAPELNQSQKIRADGKISLPLIGEADAVGKKLGEFQEELSRRYRPHLRNTDVVIALEASAIPVYVSGAVNKPGKIYLDRPMTVLEAIMEAGGLSNVGDLNKVVLIRNTNGRHNTQTFDLSPALKGRPTDAFYLRAYDMIYVPERFF